MSARQGWNAAQRASERPLLKPRVVPKPIGPKALLDGKEDFAEALRETGFRPEWPANVRFSRQKAFACCGMHACTCRLSAAQAPRARLCTCGRTFSAPALRCDDCARFQEALKNF